MSELQKVETLLQRIEAENRENLRKVEEMKKLLEKIATTL